MKITVDTNVLVRAIVGDDKKQSKVAQTELDRADVVALTRCAASPAVQGGEEWRTMDMGAPPQEEAKSDGKHSTTLP